MQRLPLPTALLCSFALLGALAGVGCASANPEAGSDGPLGTAGEAVDIAAIPANQIAVVQDGSIPAKATGVVLVPYLDANHTPITVPSTQYGNLPERGSCGITFVSPHYAITSSHCFNDTNAYDPANQTFTAETFDVSQSNVDDYYLESAMQGTYPNYTPIFGKLMNSDPGYTSTSFTCTIASRCPYIPANAGAYNCDGATAPDVTMLYCGGRAASGNWLPVASDPAITGAVYMYWFHELFSTNRNADMIAHYTNYEDGSAINWHYLGAPTNVFLPFKSVPWSATAQRTRIGTGGDNDTRTDLYGCHGTSGSGVLSRDANGNYALLGPVHQGGTAWASGQYLCEDPTLLTQGAPNTKTGTHGLTFNENGSVNSLVSAKYLLTLAFDRRPPIVRR